MSELGTGLIAQIYIDSAHAGGTPDFEVSFYVYPSQPMHFRRAELLHRQVDGVDLWYALLDTRRLGRGRLMCRFRLQEPSAYWPGGSRPVVITQDTGRFIGSARPAGYRTPPRPDYVEGYCPEVTFVAEVPAESGEMPLPPGGQNTVYDEETETLIIG